MIIYFDGETKEITKKRNTFLKPINEINQLLKNAFVSVILDTNGNMYQGVASVGIGYHMAKSELYKHLYVPEGKFMKIHTVYIYKVIKDRKKEITGYGIEDNIVYFIMNETEKFNIGVILDEFDEHKKFTDIYEMEGDCVPLSNDEMDSLINKEVVHTNDMIVTHKILPNLKKSSGCDIHIKDIDEFFFVGIFHVELANMTSIHFYRFLKL